MTNKTKQIRYTVVILMAFAALVTGVFVAQHMHKPKKIDTSKFHGTYLQSPRNIISFNLTGSDHKTFTNKDLKGQWTMIFFGFTNCGYVCPTTMAELGKTYRLLQEKNIKELPNVIMVSIDPKRDSVDKIAKYVKSFDKHFYGARGSQQEVKALTSALGIAYAKVALKNNTNPENYDIQHSGAVILVNPQGEVNAFFTSPHHADMIAEDYAMLVS